MEITVASVDQNLGDEQINSAITQLNQVTQENAGSAEQLSANASTLIEQAEQLTKTISFFKMEDNELRDSIVEISAQIQTLQEALKGLKLTDHVKNEQNEYETEGKAVSRTPKEDGTTSGVNLNLNIKEDKNNDYEQM